MSKGITVINLEKLFIKLKHPPALVHNLLVKLLSSLN